MSKKPQRVVLKKQAKEIVSKVYDFMKKEATKNHAEKLTDARWRTAKAVGVSESTVTRILNERKKQKINTTDPAVETKPDNDTLNEASMSDSSDSSSSPELDVDEEDLREIRKTVQQYKKEHGKLPTMQRLQNKLKDRLDCKPDLLTLRSILVQKLGYKRDDIFL